MSSLTIKNLNKIYNPGKNEVHAVKDFNLEIEDGEFVALLGPSGCGKTLMVHALRSNSLLNFVTIEGTDVFSKWFGEAESVVRELFACARRSRAPRTER